MLTQKSFLFLIVFIGIVLSLTQNDNYTFVIGYLGFMGMITGMMSLTMDDQSHGLTFLFSLPASSPSAFSSSPCSSLASSSISPTPCRSSRLFFLLAPSLWSALALHFSSFVCVFPTAPACASSCAANSDKHPLTACAQSCNIMRVAKSLHACGPFEKWFNSLAPHASIHGFESRTGYALRIFSGALFCFQLSTCLLQRPVV